MKTPKTRVRRGARLFALIAATAFLTAVQPAPSYAHEMTARDMLSEEAYQDIVDICSQYGTVLELDVMTLDDGRIAYVPVFEDGSTKVEENYTSEICDSSVTQAHKFDIQSMYYKTSSQHFRQCIQCDRDVWASHYFSGSRRILDSSTHFRTCVCGFMQTQGHSIYVVQQEPMYIVGCLSCDYWDTY